MCSFSFERGIQLAASSSPDASDGLFVGRRRRDHGLLKEQPAAAGGSDSEPGARRVGVRPASPPRCRFARERPPEPVALGEASQEGGIDRPLVRIAEVSGVGVRDALDEAVVALDGGGLLEPELGRAMPEERQQACGLAAGCRAARRHARSRTARRSRSLPDGLVRIRIGDCAVVLNWLLGKPTEDAMHRRRPEADCAKSLR